jgi:DNA-binding response OmpR family regulator
MPTLLIVDDNQSVRDTFGPIFTRYGYAVSLAKNGDEALALFVAHGAEAALVDIHMPGGLNGIEVCRAMLSHAKAIKRTVHVWLMTGAPDKNLTKLGLESGAIEVLNKPFDLAVFERQLAEKIKRTS